MQEKVHQESAVAIASREMTAEILLVRPAVGRLRPYLWLVLLASIAGELYCFLALAMVGSLSGAPKYSLERAQFNQRCWGAGLTGCAVVALTCVWGLAQGRLLRKTRAKE